MANIVLPPTIIQYQSVNMLSENKAGLFCSKIPSPFPHNTWTLALGPKHDRTIQFHIRVFAKKDLFSTM